LKPRGSEVARALDVPKGEIGLLAHGDGAPVLEAQGAGGIGGDAQERLFGG
jgi:hypothetical protein